MSSKRIVGLVAVAFGGGLFGLLILESVARTMHLAPLPAQYGANIEDEVIAYRRQPGSHLQGTSESGEFTFDYRHNSLGFRDVDHPAIKAEGTFRIVALGDSFTYGVGADFDDTYLSRLERQLNARPGAHPRVEIIRLGLPRQYPRLERLTLEKYGLAFHPDLVMIALLPNDVVDTHRDLAVCASGSGYLVPCDALRWGEAGVWLATHSSLVRLFLQWRATWGEGRWLDLFVEDGPYEPDWRVVEGELERTKALAGSVGAPLVVVAIPQMPPWRPAQSYPETRLARWCRDHGAHFAPTLGPLKAAEPSAKLYWKKDGHCTPAGYAVIADAIAASLISQGLIP